MTGNEFYENEWQHKINNDISRIEKNENVDIIKGFHNYLIAKGTMISSRRNYINKIVAFVNKLNKSIYDIGFVDYLNFITQYQDKTSSYQVQIHAALANFSEYLYNAKITKEDYMIGIKKPKSRESIETIQRRQKSYLTQEEMERFILNAKYGNNKRYSKTEELICYRNYALVMLMLNTGLRCSALSKIDISDINFDKSELQITEKRGKIRTCVISDQLMQIILDWIDTRTEITNIEDNALFITLKGNRLNTRAIRKIVEECGDGIKDIKITPHKLRATYGTTIYEKTGDIYLTQQCMGHSNVQTTMLYVRGQEEKAQKKAAEIMSGLTF